VAVIETGSTHPPGYPSRSAARLRLHRKQAGASEWLDVPPIAERGNEDSGPIEGPVIVQKFPARLCSINLVAASAMVADSVSDWHDDDGLVHLVAPEA